MADLTRTEAGIRCRWCGASIPVSNVWICEVEVVALCTGCGRLTPGGPYCPACGAPMTSISNLQEAIVRQALAQGARVEIVDGPAAAQLRECGSIGGWTRF